MKLSKHFTLDEFTFSQTAARNMLDNTPTDVQIASLKRLCVEVLEPVREHFDRPVRISSGYRGPDLNRAVRGSRSSQHCKGEAADFTVPGVTVLELCQWMHRNLNYDQLIYEFGRWVHVSYGPRMRNQELTARKIRVNGRRKTQYIPGIVA